MAQRARQSSEYIARRGRSLFKEWSLKIASYAVSFLAAFSFLGAATAKFLSDPMMKAQFEFFGLPLAFMYVIAVAESVGSVLLFTRYRQAGALALSVVAVGAAGEHLTHGQASHAPAAPILAMLAWIGVYLHRASRNSAAEASSSQR